MRLRWLAAVAGTTLVALSGCEDATAPAPAQRAASAPPAPVVPHSGECHRSVEPISYPSSAAPVRCTTTHSAETVSVHTFTGRWAAAPSPPTAGSPALRAAFAACDADVRRFVGADWRGGNLSIQAATPSPVDWSHGIRWFRCDVFEIDPLDRGSYRRHPEDHPRDRTTSLAGALTTVSAMSYHCFNEDAYEQLQPVACTAPHRFEYAGTWTAPDSSHDSASRAQERNHEGCRSTLATGARRADRDLVERSGTTYRLPSPEAWTRGDRGIRCFLWLDQRALSRPVLARAPRRVGA